MKIVSKAAILALIAALAAPAFAEGGKENAATKVDQIKKAGKIILGTSADYPPYEFHILKDGKDEIVGFDVSIGKEIAKDLGVELEIKDMAFDGLLAALQSGNIDMVIAGMTPTDERKQSVDFSTVYYYAVHGVIVRATDTAKYPDVAALKAARLSAQKGTIQVDIAKRQILGLSEAEAEKDDSVKQLSTIKNLVLDLKNGKVDAIVCELPVANAYVSKNPDLALASMTFTDDDGGSAIAVKKGSPELMAAINKTLERLLASKAIDGFVAEANDLVEN